MLVEVHKEPAGKLKSNAPPCVWIATASPSSSPPVPGYVIAEPESPPVVDTCRKTLENNKAAYDRIHHKAWGIFCTAPKLMH